MNHVVPSYELFMGRGYRHDPVTHGPFQFHVVALTYFLLGDNDFTSRIPAALLGTAAVAFVLIFYRRYLGKIGGLLAGIFFMISPYMLFYSRYTRNEAFIMLFGVVMLYAVLQYLEDGKLRWLYLLTLSLTLHFCAKETAYIYAAEILVFIGGLALYDLFRHEWQSENEKKSFYLTSLVSALVFLAAIVISIIVIRISKSGLQANPLSASPALALNDTITQLMAYFQSYGRYFIPIVLPLIAGIIILILLKKKLIWDQLPTLRSFHLLVLLSNLGLALAESNFLRAGWH